MENFLDVLPGSEDPFPGIRVAKNGELATFAVSFHNCKQVYSIDAKINCKKGLHFSAVAQSFNIFPPFPREQVLFLRVTFFACSHYIPFCAFTAARKGYNVIHGEIPGVKFFPAIVADSPGFLAVPPLRFSQLSGLFFLSFYFSIGYADNETIFHVLK